MNVVGISAWYHDSAAALVRDGLIVAAAQEERFTRKRHDSAFPANALRYCLQEGGLALEQVDHVVFYEKPFLKFERLLQTYTALAPKGFRSFRMAIPLWIGKKLYQRKMLTDELRQISSRFDPSRLLFTEHHHSHAASAFFPSPFREATILTMDGVGEWTTTSTAIGRGNQIEIVREMPFPHSLGLLYSAFTYYTGFKVNSGEYKLMGLAPYGEALFRQKILDHLIDLKPDGTFRLNQKYFDYCGGLTMTNAAFEELFGAPVRQSSELLTQFHMDIAASIQSVLEEIVLRLVRSAVSQTGIRNLCLAGGVALNCVANGRILRDGVVENLWVQPAAGDAGGALGAALAGYYAATGTARDVDGHGDAMRGGYLGPSFLQGEIESRLTGLGARYEVLSEDAMLDACVGALTSEKAVGWFQGRMEFGPRALGARSILGDARSPGMQSALNLKVKYRESFRPFAPSVLREEVANWFELDGDSAYMLLVADVARTLRLSMTPEEQSLFGIDKLKVPRSTIPAVTHVDYSARVQTVHRETNPLYHRLISKFRDQTGCPVIVNTSFNVRGEPIVATPEDAFRCFMGTEIDLLAIGNCILRKDQQDAGLRADYRNSFDPD